jgi:Tol biopolymer transport system component
VLLKGTYQSQVYLGELAKGGTRMNPPRRLTNDEAYDCPAAWTPDRKAVLFQSNRNGIEGIFKQGISQETSEAVITGPQDVGFPVFSADGAWMLYVETPRTQANPAPPDRLMRIPASGGVPQFVLETRHLLDFRCARAPASLCVIFETNEDRKQLVITAFDPLKGRGKVLRTIENDPSHDREITVKGWPNITGLDRAPDGKGYYCGSVSPQGNTLLYVDLKGSARVLWQNKGGFGGQIWGVLSPDGRYLAIEGAVTNSNVWMIEGF